MKYTFPQYRKLSNEQSYYKIDSLEKMTENSRMGSKWTQFDMLAKILPDRVLISDILENEGGRYLIIEAEEYEQILAEWTKKLSKF